MFNPCHQPGAALSTAEFQITAIGFGSFHRRLLRPQLDRFQLVCKHQTLHQGVAGEAIGAVESCARHFTNGKEPRQVGCCLQIGGNTTHPVVRGWRYGDWMFQRIQSKFTAPVQDCWEACFGLFSGNRTEVKPDLSHPLPFHRLHQGPTHLVAGR